MSAVSSSSTSTTTTSTPSPAKNSRNQTSSQSKPVRIPPPPPLPPYPHSLYPRSKGCPSETPNRDLHPGPPPYPSKRVGRPRLGDIRTKATIQQHQARAQLCALRPRRCQPRRCSPHPRTRRCQRVCVPPSTRIPRSDSWPRRALANVQASMGIPSAPTNGGDVEMTEEVPPALLPKEVIDQIDETQQSLSATRKKRKAPAGYTTPADIKTFMPKQTIPSLHSASPAGINSIAISHLSPSQFLTGGNDKIVQLYDRSTDKVLASLKGHTKKVNHVAFRDRDGEPTLLLSAGSDKIAKIWSYDSPSGEYLPRATITSHKSDLTGLVVHPTSTLVAYSSLDKTYSLHELSNFSQVYHSTPADDPFTSLAVHPDGALLALGTPSSKIQICDIRSGTVATTISPGGTPFSVNTLSFSENGYHLLAPDSLSSVAVWDLRKMTTVHSIPLGDAFKINKVIYDYGASFFGVAGNEGVRLFAHKTWEELVRFEEASDVTDLAFGNQGKEVWGTSGREVRIWGAPE